MPTDPSLPIEERPDYYGTIHVHPAPADAAILSAESVYPLFYCEKDTTIDAASFNTANYLLTSGTSFAVLYYNTTLSTTGATEIARVTIEATGGSAGDVDEFDLTPGDGTTINNRVPAGNTIFMVGFDAEGDIPAPD